MKKVMSVLINLMFVVSIVGCAPAAATAAPTESAPVATEAATVAVEPTSEPSLGVSTIVLNDWSWVDAAWTDCLTKVFDNFKATNGDKVDLQVVGSSYADTLNTLLVQAAAGNGPDVAMIKAEWIPQFLELDVLAPIQDVISDEAKADYGDSLSAYTVDGNLIALPFFSQGYAMFYNKDLLQKAGITELPTTFDELLADSQKISGLGKDDNGNTIYGLGLVNSGLEVAEGYNIFPWLWARGGDFLDSNGNVVLNSEPNLKAFTEIQALYANGVSPKGLSYKEMRNLFASGDLGFFWDLQSQTASFAKASALGDDFINHIGAFPIPGANKGDGVGYVSDVVLVVFKTTKDLNAAGIVTEYLGSEATIQVMYDFGKGKMSARESVMEHVFANVNDSITQAYVEAMNTSRRLPGMNIAFSDADQAITNSVTRMATGVDPAKVLAALDAEVKGLYNQK